MHTDSYPVGLVPSDSDVQDGRLAVKRPAAGRSPACGVPRQVARGAWSVSFRVCLWPSTLSGGSTINNDVTNHEACGRASRSASLVVLLVIRIQASLDF